MLILDQTLDKKTLEVDTTQSCQFYRDTPEVPQSESSNKRSIVSAPAYRGHLSAWEKVVKPKKDKPDKNNRKRKRFHNPPESTPCVVEAETVIPRAEEVVQLLLSRALFPNHRDEIAVSSRPRKVSNADSSDNRMNLTTPLGPVDTIVNEEDLSRFLEQTEAGTVSVAVEKTELPAFLEASIVTESTLRRIALLLCERFVRSVDTTTLSFFMGYRTRNNRDRVLPVFADHLFSVSHAMFAWEQTEAELLSNGRTLLSERQADRFVSDTLFGGDAKALQKIGGLDDSSLLPHALSIARLSQQNVSWATEALTDQGRALLKHHHGSADVRISVGQKRRRSGRPRLPGGITSEVKPARTTGDSQSKQADAVDGDSIMRPNAALATSSAASEENILARVTIHLARQSVQKSWGVLLCKRGEQCVVARGGGGTEVAETSKAEATWLHKDDVIVSVENERGACAKVPARATTAGSAASAKSFEDIVALFQSSKRLEVQVLRACVELPVSTLG